jgi:hypothetical protein
MTCEATCELLRLLRNILLRSVVIGVVFALILGVLTIAGWQTWIGLTMRWFHTDEATLTPLVLKFFIDIRFFLLFFLLTPGLAIHWTLKKEQAKTR